MFRCRVCECSVCAVQQSQCMRCMQVLCADAALNVPRSLPLCPRTAQLSPPSAHLINSTSPSAAPHTIPPSQTHHHRAWHEAATPPHPALPAPATPACIQLLQCSLLSSLTTACARHVRPRGGRRRRRHGGRHPSARQRSHHPHQTPTPHRFLLFPRRPLLFLLLLPFPRSV